MHSEATQSLRTRLGPSSALGGHSGGVRSSSLLAEPQSPTWPTNPSMRTNCDTARPAHTFPPPNARPPGSAESHPVPRQNRPHRTRTPPQTEEGLRQTPPARAGHPGVVPPEKHCEPQAKLRKNAASIGRRRVATGANHPASRSSAFRRGPGTPAAALRRGTRAPI